MNRMTQKYCHIKLIKKGQVSVLLNYLFNDRVMQGPSLKLSQSKGNINQLSKLGHSVTV